MEHSRSELKAGAMILVALFMLLVIIFSVSDIESLFIPMTKVRVWFQEVRGLKVNDPVLYAGVNVGRVASLKVEEGKDGEPPKVVLSLEIESRYRLRQGNPPGSTAGRWTSWLPTPLAASSGGLAQARTAPN